MSPSRRVLRLPGVLALVFLFSQALTPAFGATTYTITLQTDSPAYSGTQPIKISGVISPAPGPNTGVIIIVRNSAGAIADVSECFPDPNTGSFNDTSVPGGNAYWISGTFSINATWGANGATASQVVTFVYSPASTTTTSSTSSTSSTSMTTTSSTSTSTTTSTTSLSTTVSTSTTPEFPSSVLAMVALVGLALVAVLSRRTSLRPLESMSR